MKLPRISVITISLNAALSIRRTIESVISQPYPNLEYIIIDGGSTDKTMGIVHSYGNSIANAVSEKDGGISDGFNKGIRRATGDIVGILNADDYYLPGALASVAEAYDGRSVLHGDLMVPRSDSRGTRIKRSSPEAYSDLKRGKMGRIFHPTVFVPRNIYARFSFDPMYHCAMDYDLLARIAKAGLPFRYVPTVIAFMDSRGVSERKYGLAIRETMQSYHREFADPMYINTAAAYFKLVKHWIRLLLEQLHCTRFVELYRGVLKGRYD